MLLFHCTESQKTRLRALAQVGEAGFGVQELRGGSEIGLKQGREVLFGERNGWMRCMGTTQKSSLETWTVEDVLKVVDRLVLEHLGQPVVFDRRYGRVRLLLLLLLLLVLVLVLVLELCLWL